MEIETILFAAVQSSFLLGLLHGVNPCGHSWLVLAPFVTGERSGARVATLTGAFVGGTALACLVLGASLGAISSIMPPSLGVWVEGITSIILITIGLLLLYNPNILHHHDHDHDHNHCDHHHHDDHTHTQCAQPKETQQSDLIEKQSLVDKLKELTKNKKLLPLALFCIGFVNMIIPCPTAAVMYGYALNSGSTFAATLVFGTYAVSTAITVSAVIFLIFKATNMATSLQKEWIEPLIMRLAGGIIVIFSSYGLYQVFAT